MCRTRIPMAVAAAVTLVAAIGLPGLAASEASREVSRDYTIERVRVHGSETDPWIGTQREFFRSEKGERWAAVSIEDDSGLPVAGRVEVGGKAFSFCSSTPQPIRVRPRERVAVSATLGLCGMAPSVVTKGSISVSFSRSAR